MSRRSLLWPLTLIIAFGVMTILLTVGALPTPTVAQSDPCAALYPTPGPERDGCYLTATARVPAAYPNVSATPEGDGQPAPPPAPAATSTPTPMATTTVTSTMTPATATVEPTSTATSTRQPAGSPTPTATSTLTGLETITCFRGATVTIQGVAEPGLALLAYFDARPVGGALVRADGTYTILLSVGEERPGLYLVQVRERDSRDLLRELACEVPGATATPTTVLAP